MRYTLFGRTGLRVSELALGAMTFGDDSGWGADRPTSERILNAYADAGGNFVDTANTYTEGHSERVVGELLRGRRERFVLASKYTCLTREGDVNAVGNHRKNLVQSVEASLQRLGTDYLDVLWVHARDVHTPGFAGSVAARLARHGVPPSALQLEITEHVLLEDPQRPAASVWPPPPGAPAAPPPRGLPR